MQGWPDSHWLHGCASRAESRSSSSGPSPSRVATPWVVSPGSCVFHGLGTYERQVDQAIPLERYELASGTGQVLQAFDLSVLTGAVGPLLMISRSDLVRLLESSCTDADLRRGVTVSSLVQHPDVVEVGFDDGTVEPFDAVVACDGVDSSTRDMVFGPAKGYDSGWMLWTWWADAKRFDPTVAREWWGAGCIFGLIRPRVR